MHIFLKFLCVIFGTFGNNAYLCNVNINNNNLEHRRQRETAAKHYEDYS